MRLIYGLFVLGLAPACVMSRTDRTSETPQEVRSPEESIQDALELIAGTGTIRASPAQILGNLEINGGSPDAKEREMIAALTPVVEKVARAEGSLGPEDYRSVYNVMGKFAAQRPNDFETQYLTATGMSTMEASLAAAGSDSPTTGESRAKELAARFPAQARAHLHLGRTLETSNELAAMRSYARCLKLDPGIVGCKTGLKEAALRYQEPRCASVAPKKLTFHAAYEPNAATAKTRKGLKPIKVDKRQLLMESKSSLDGGAVDEAHQAGQGVDQAVVLTLSPRGAATLADLTGRLAERRGFLAILVDGKVHAAPQVMSAVESGVVTVGGIALTKLCAKLEMRPLPADVARLLK